jgi:MFS family permease
MPMSASASTTARPRYRLLKTLEHSQREAVASSTMTATCDNYMNAFALHLGATSIQMGFLTAVPQLLGSLMQLVSVWLGTFLTRRMLVLLTAVMQAALMFAFAALAVQRSINLVPTLILLVILYHCASHLIQPQWRAWMGSLVPQKQRGVFFAARTRLTMATSLAVFLGGGLFLSFTDIFGMAWLGFAFLFVVAMLGRAFSCYFLFGMHDPAPQPVVPVSDQFYTTLRIVREAFSDGVFRHYSLFVAGMQGMVAISGPFFAVYMLNELQMSYFQYSINQMVYIATQFAMLPLWGRLNDKHGSRYIMLVCSTIMPIVPVLWLFSTSEWYLLLVQVVSGLVWSGFNLTTANYLYDIRPHQTNFATYAAIQAIVTAGFVFVGGISGGYLAALSAVVVDWFQFDLTSSLYIVFVTSGILRAVVLLWFIPRAEEPRIRRRSHLLKLVYRVARYNSISGIVLDWLTVTEKENKDQP